MKSQIPLVGSVLHPTDFSDASNQAFAHALAISVIRQTKQPAFSDFRRVERERLQICGARLKPCSSYEGVPRTLAARSHRALHGRFKKPPQLAASLGCRGNRQRLRRDISSRSANDRHRPYATVSRKNALNRCMTASERTRNGVLRLAFEPTIKDLLTLRLGDKSPGRTTHQQHLLL